MFMDQIDQRWRIYTLGLFSVSELELKITPAVMHFDAIFREKAEEVEFTTLWAPPYWGDKEANKIERSIYLRISCHVMSK